MMGAVTGMPKHMTDLHMPELRRAKSSDWETIRKLLEESSLPTDDLAQERLDSFLVAEDGDRLIGLIGLELLGTAGLLRSLVVAKEARRAGLGGKLVGSLEAAAQTAGVTEMWLLTVDAQKFFEGHGYREISRAQAPDAVRSTGEFNELCPDDASLMMKAMEP